MSNARSAGREVNREERNKRIAIGVFGVVLLGIGIYAYNAFFSNSTPAPPPVPLATAQPSTTVTKSSTANAAQGNAGQGNGGQNNGGQGNAAQTPGISAAPGVDATKMASTSSSLDPTLDESAMLRTESLVYSGSGRNIFSATSFVETPKLPEKLPPARPVTTAPVAPGPTGPPPPPPINLKYFGTQMMPDGRKQAFLLSGEDVYMATQGDIVARKYKIVSIGANSIQVEDLSNQNTQTLPLQTN